MTDDEIDAAIRAAVPAECFVPNAGAREIYRAGYRAGVMRASKEAMCWPDIRQSSDDVKGTAFGIAAAIRALAD